MEPNDSQVHSHFESYIHAKVAMFKAFVGKENKHQIMPLGYH
jgi:hypothetical protein